jgi:hypothetical protein
VAYEQVRGLREKHEKPGGFEISRSRTIAAGVAAAFEAWSDAPPHKVTFLQRSPALRRRTRLPFYDGRIPLRR